MTIVTELNTFIDRKHPEQTLTALGGEIAFIIDLPTQVVVTSTQIVTPRTARVYKTPWLAKGDMVWFDEDSSCQTRYSLPDVYLIEVWTNNGRAGLIRFEMIGWRFVSANELQEATRERQGWPWPPLVYFIGERPGDRPGVPIP